MESESASLLMRARGGSSEAWDALYGRCASKLLALIRVRMGQALRAQLESRDILQGALLKGFERLPQFHGESGASLMAWLARIAENELRDRVDHQHRQRRDAAQTVGLEEAGAEVQAQVRSALSQLVWTEQAERLERALESLEEAQRELIVLRKLEELSFKEIGLRLEKSEDACRMAFGRAMAELTRRVAEP
jgi:RNA polymerase sigma-70 factor (ECF subfamily)